MKTLDVLEHFDKTVQQKPQSDLFAVGQVLDSVADVDLKISEPDEVIVEVPGVDEQVEVANPSGRSNRAAVLLDGSKTKIQSRGFSESGSIEADPESNDSNAPNLDFLLPSKTDGSLGRLQQFEILRVMVQGGMGLVLEGFDSLLQRPVAIKVLSPRSRADVLALRRFCRESRAMANCLPRPAATAPLAFETCKTKSETEYLCRSNNVTLHF